MSKLTAAQQRSVNGLMFTSVDDARSSLGCNRYSEAVLREAFNIAKRRGEKTRAKLLAAALHRLEKHKTQQQGRVR